MCVLGVDGLAHVYLYLDEYINDIPEYDCLQ